MESRPDPRRTCEDARRNHQEAPGTYEVVELEVDDPRQGEIQVEDGGAGLCHSDDHIATGDIPVGMYPFCGGHEGAGVVDGGRAATRRAGRRATTWSSRSCRRCGQCRWCARGHAEPVRPRRRRSRRAPAGTTRPASGSRRRPAGRPDVRHLDLLRGHHGLRRLRGEGARRHPARQGLPARAAASAPAGARRSTPPTYAPGDTVIVMGIGGIGINAVQGAAHAGAAQVIAVDPVEFKREQGAGARRHPRRRDHGGGHRAGPVGHQRPGRGLRDRHRRRHHRRARRPGAGRRSARPAPWSSPASATSRRSASPISLAESRSSRSGSRARSSAPRPDRRTSRSCCGSTRRAAQARRAGHPHLQARRDRPGYEDMHAGTNLRGVVVF